MDSALCMHSNQGMDVLIVVYLDDLLITGRDEVHIGVYIGKIKERFEVRESYGLTKFLGISVNEGGSYVKLHHTGMICRMLKNINMSDYNPTLCPITPGTNLFILETEPTL